MTHRLTHILVTLAAVLMLAVGSAMSAGLMAPEREDAARAQVAAMGLSADEICGTQGDHAHRCPFCHTLPEAPRVAAPDLTRRVSTVIADATGRDLVTARAPVAAPVGLRAPPLFS